MKILNYILFRLQKPNGRACIIFKNVFSVLRKGYLIIGQLLIFPFNLELPFYTEAEGGLVAKQKAYLVEKYWIEKNFNYQMDFCSKGLFRYFDLQGGARWSIKGAEMLRRNLLLV